MSALTQAKRVADAEPIPGYRLIEPLGKGGFGEVWKCRAPGGFLKAIKFVGGNNSESTINGADQELRALDHLKTLRHPFLLSVERVEVIDGDLMIVTELADRSLHDLLQEVRQTGKAGVSRDEVIFYLREAAEVLDEMNQVHGLQHLDIKPRNLFLVGRHVKVADFGLVASLSDLNARGDLLGGITPLYAAPEIFQNKASMQSDQYSLAVTYHELMTGHVVFEGRNFNHLMMMALTTEANLSRVGEPDRVVLKRALSKVPEERYPSCTAFVEALAAVGDVQGPASGRSRQTAFDMHLGELSTTGLGSTMGASGLRRRESRIMRTVVTPAVARPETPLPGYQLLECLTRGETGELWRARGPRGDARLVRFLNPATLRPGEESPFDRLQAVHHDFLAEHELVELPGGRFALVTEAGETTLAQGFKDARAAGQNGLPRDHLLRHLGGIAQALDEIYADHGLQHLSLSPRHLAVSRGDPILLEFGLAELFWMPAGVNVAGLNPRYAAVEQFDGLVSDACDQYALAAIYQELLTGMHPFRNLNAKQMASAKLRGRPDVSMVPASDRGVLLQALSAEPDKRFRSCREFVDALENGTGRTTQATTGTVSVPALVVPTRMSMPAVAVVPSSVSSGPAPWRVAIDEIVMTVGRGHEIRTVGATHYRYTAGRDIDHRGWARLASGMVRLKLAGFREQWSAECVEETPTSWAFEIREKGGFWSRMTSAKTPGVRIDVRLGTPRELNGGQTPVHVRIYPVDAGPRAEALLSETGLALLQSVQGYLGCQSDRAGQERFPFAQAAQIEMPTAGISLPAKTIDVGRNAMAILSDRPVPCGAVRVMTNRIGAPVTFEVPGWVRECRQTGKQFEVEVELGGA